jgi:repressor of nif and glnA expression
MSNLSKKIEAYEAKIEAMVNRTELDQYQFNGAICMNIYHITLLQSDDPIEQHAIYNELITKYQNLGYIKPINTD